MSSDAMSYSVEFDLDAIAREAARMIAKAHDQRVLEILERTYGFVRPVRCEECRHYIPEFGYSEERGFGQVEYLMEPPACARSAAVQVTVTPDGFCAWGERRDA